MIGRPRMIESKRREQYRSYKVNKRCRAAGCAKIPLETGFCGYHEEMLEDGEPFPLKPIPHSNAQRCAKAEEQKQMARDAAREALKEIQAKREARKAS